MQLSRHAVTRLPLFALSLLIVLTLAGTAAVRWTGVSARAPDAPAVHTRQLRFEDRPDGAVAVIDADSRVSCAAHCARWRASGACAPSAPNRLSSCRPVQTDA
jgi:hypothetical protein